MPTSKHHAEPGFICAAWNDVLIHVWADTITPNSLDASAEALEALADASGRRVGIVTVLEHSVRLPDDGVRQRAAELMRGNRSRVAAEATVVLGDGFRSSALRTVYATLMLVARCQHPRYSGASVDEGGRFVIETLGHAATGVADLVAAIENARTLVRRTSEAREAEAASSR